MRLGLLLFVGLVAGPAFAVPARPGLTTERRGQVVSVVGDERGYSLVHDGVSLSVHRSLGRPLDYARVPVPATGVARVFLVGVDFPDRPAGEPFGDTAGRIAGALTSYLAEVSRQQLTLLTQPLLTTWVRAGLPYATYGADGLGVDDRHQPIYELAREVLLAADPWVDFRSLDGDGDGVLEMGEAHLVIVHAGHDQASTGWSDDIWSHRWWIYGGAMTLDGVRIAEPDGAERETTAGYVMVARSDPLGVIVHELLHGFGAPDLYAVSGGSAVPVGPWSVMDIGLWLGSAPGTQPCRPGGYLEWDLDADPNNGISGWLTPVFCNDGAHRLVALGSGQTDVHLVRTPFPTEYFLVENRVREGVDTALPEAGILIYHIDTAEPVNNVESRPPFRVWLEDPGQRPLKRGAAYSRDDGPSQTAFTPVTNPSSVSNHGEDTGVAIMDIGPRGPVMTYHLAGTTPVVQTDRLLVWPVPARPGTTVNVVVPTGAPADGRLLLMDLAGRCLVSRDLPGGAALAPLDLPDRPHGVFVLVYRTPTSVHASVVPLTP